MDGPATAMVINFDKDLVGVGALDLANWTVRWNNLVWTVSAALAVGNQVQLAGAAGAGNPGADVVSFAPPPFDVLTLENDRPVVAFTDFPLTA